MNNRSKEAEIEALQRYAMIDRIVRAHLEAGEKSALLRELSLEYGVSISTLKRYLKRYIESGQEGLQRRQRTDIGKLRRLPEQELQRAIEVRT